MLSLRLAFLFAVCSAKVTSQNVEGASDLCPDHWIDATLSGLGCLFFNSTTAVTWEDAANLCQHPDNNASLVEIWSELQFDFIRSELMFLQDNGVDNDWWIGATDQGREGRWYWAGSLATVGDFIWYPSTPDDGYRGTPDDGTDCNCAMLQNTKSWEFLGDDLPCSAEKYFICQKK